MYILYPLLGPSQPFPPLRPYRSYEIPIRTKRTVNNNRNIVINRIFRLNRTVHAIRGPNIFSKRHKFQFCDLSLRAIEKTYLRNWKFWNCLLLVYFSLFFSSTNWFCDFISNFLVNEDVKYDKSLTNLLKIPRPSKLNQ